MIAGKYVLRSGAAGRVKTAEESKKISSEIFYGHFEVHIYRRSRFSNVSRIENINSPVDSNTNLFRPRRKLHEVDRAPNKPS